MGKDRNTRSGSWRGGKTSHGSGSSKHLPAISSFVAEGPNNQDQKPISVLLCPHNSNWTAVKQGLFSVSWRIQAAYYFQKIFSKMQILHLYMDLGAGIERIYG
jgi:hypothetical protein